MAKVLNLFPHLLSWWFYWLEQLVAACYAVSLWYWVSKCYLAQVLLSTRNFSWRIRHHKMSNVLYTPRVLHCQSHRDIEISIRSTCLFLLYICVFFNVWIVGQSTRLSDIRMNVDAMITSLDLSTLYVPLIVTCLIRDTCWGFAFCRSLVSAYQVSYTLSLFLPFKRNLVKLNFQALTIYVMILQNIWESAFKYQLVFFLPVSHCRIGSTCYTPQIFSWFQKKKKKTNNSIFKRALLIAALECCFTSSLQVIWCQWRPSRTWTYY